MHTQEIQTSAAAWKLNSRLEGGWQNETEKTEVKQIDGGSQGRDGRMTFTPRDSFWRRVEVLKQTRSHLQYISQRVFYLYIYFIFTLSVSLNLSHSLSHFLLHGKRT